MCAGASPRPPPPLVSPSRPIHSRRATTSAPTLDDGVIVGTIINGDRTGGMPAQDLSDQEVADVLAYVRATFG